MLTGLVMCGGWCVSEQLETELARVVSTLYDSNQKVDKPTIFPVNGYPPEIEEPQRPCKLMKHGLVHLMCGWTRNLLDPQVQFPRIEDMLQRRYLLSLWTQFCGWQLNKKGKQTSFDPSRCDSKAAGDVGSLKCLSLYWRDLCCEDHIPGTGRFSQLFHFKLETSSSSIAIITKEFLIHEDPDDTVVYWHMTVLDTDKSLWSGALSSFHMRFVNSTSKQSHSFTLAKILLSTPREKRLFGSRSKCLRWLIVLYALQVWSRSVASAYSLLLWMGTMQGVPLQLAWLLMLATFLTAASAKICIFNDAFIPNISVSLFNPYTHDQLYAGKPLFGRQMEVEMNNLTSALVQFAIPSDGLDVTVTVPNGSHVLLQDCLVMEYRRRVGMIGYLVDEADNILDTLFTLWRYNTPWKNEGRNNGYSSLLQF